MKCPLIPAIVLLTAMPAMAAGGSNPFEGTIYQAVAAVVVFLVVFAVSKKKAWGPILKGLKDREAKIANDLNTAQRSAQEAQQKLAEYEQRLEMANEEVRALLDQGRSEAQKLGTQLKEQAETEIGQMRHRAASEIDAAKQQALSDVYAQTATIATEVAGRILKRQINPQDQQQLVQTALDELSSNNQN